MYKPNHELTIKNVSRLNELLERSGERLLEIERVLQSAVTHGGHRDVHLELLPQDEQPESVKSAMYALQCCRAAMEMMDNG